MRKALFVAAAAVSLWLAPGALGAGWCGTGEVGTDRPDAVTGSQIHPIVAVAADTPDTFVASANRIADDVASIVAWWTTQDSTRVPRFDEASFPSGTCLDISFVRLPGNSSTYQGDPAYTQIQTQLRDAGFANLSKTYFVYYDGPSVAPNLCGTGSAPAGPDPPLAIVWTAGCPNVPTDGIGAHELLHAFGALPDGAPNWCRTSPVTGKPDHFHPCDSPTDVLYPAASGSPLSALVLDFGHDDYYAHNGSWLDIQDSLFLHRLDLPAIPLALGFSGAGSVTSNVPGIECTAACTTQWDSGSQVILTADGGAATRFVRWTGGCTGDNDCLLTLTQPVSATAVFGPLRIPLKVTTAGKGTVKCTPKCTKTFPGGDPLALRAVPQAGWKFAGWSGGCKGTKVTCTPATDFALSVKATFRRR